MFNQEALLTEWKQELETTRKMLQRVPEKFDWLPHAKSMSLGQLAIHVAEIPSWMKVTLDTDVLDFAEGYTPNVCKNQAELMELFEKSAEESIACLEAATAEKMAQIWTMRNGAQVYFQLPKSAVMRTWVFSHLIHHRAQLGVYLRLLDIPIPGSYGPTADDQMG